ncbi:hypothetical protein NERG_02047 [Nematocida ausubeli]|uniref:Uncharacterized protein n=1 Tax=Nematocida ausubeli (strain ATCC PRA-371 / ERTm2) TaxID=1913371 RepID=H8ZEM6_NEMA1|nr:hypothetical protein NERG_02047 [Nematocida ausubeli]
MRVNNTRVLKIAKFSVLAILIVFIIGFCIYKMVGIKKNIYNLGTNNPLFKNIQVVSKAHDLDESDIDSSLKNNLINNDSEFKFENQNYEHSMDNSSMDNNTTNEPENKPKQTNPYNASEKFSKVERDDGYGSSNSLSSFNLDEKEQNIPSSVQTSPSTSTHNQQYTQQPSTSSHNSQSNVIHIPQKQNMRFFTRQSKQRQKDNEHTQNGPFDQPIEFSVYEDEYRKFESNRSEHTKGYSVLFNESADLDANYQNSSNDYNEDEDLSDFSTYNSLLDIIKTPDSEPKEQKNSVNFNMQDVSYEDVSTAISMKDFKDFTEKYNKLKDAYMFSKFTKIANNLKDNCNRTSDTLDKCLQIMLTNIDQQKNLKIPSIYTTITEIPITTTANTIKATTITKVPINTKAATTKKTKNATRTTTRTEILITAPTSTTTETNETKPIDSTDEANETTAATNEANETNETTAATTEANETTAATNEAKPTSTTTETNEANETNETNETTFASTDETNETIIASKTEDTIATPIDSTDETLISTIPIKTSTHKSTQDPSGEYLIDPSDKNLIDLSGEDLSDKNLSDKDTNSKPLKLKTLIAPNFVSITKNLGNTKPIPFFGYGPSNTYLGNGRDYDLYSSEYHKYDSTDPISPSVEGTV